MHTKINLSLAVAIFIFLYGSLWLSQLLLGLWDNQKICFLNAYIPVYTTPAYEHIHWVFLWTLWTNMLWGNKRTRPVCAFRISSRTHGATSAKILRSGYLRRYFTEFQESKLRRYFLRVSITKHFKAQFHQTL